MRRVGPLPGKTSFNNYQFGSHRQTPIFTIMIVIISLSRRWRSTRGESEWSWLLLKHSIIHCGCRGAFRNKSKPIAMFLLQLNIRLCSILFSECRRMKQVEGRWVELEMKIVFPPVRPRPSVRRAMMGRRRLRLRNSIMSAMGELSEDKDHLPLSISLTRRHDFVTF